MTAIPDTLITTYLEMTSPDAFQPAYIEHPGLEIALLPSIDVPGYRELYRLVGERWRWRDRNLLSDAELAAILSAPENTIYVLTIDGDLAGYIELEKQGTSTEIVYFGLAEAYIGRGLGKHLLSYGIAQAWENGAQRIWLHTCNLDGPHALDNYRKRGFSVYNVTEEPMPQHYH